jgi:SAM-dependent methyltransferase
MDCFGSDIAFERPGRLSRLSKKLLVNPLANYLPAGWLKALLRAGDSQLAKANWADPGGWKSMVMSYDGQTEKIADKILIGGGTIPKALRNRKLLGVRAIARLIDAVATPPAHILCVGAGPGRIVMEAMIQARQPSLATLVDLNSDAFAEGRRAADALGLSDRIRFLVRDVRDGAADLIETPPDIVKMIGICEYLSDEQIRQIARAVAQVMSPGAAIVFNSLSLAHGTDRFFRRVFGLHMNHRSAEQLEALIAPAGFADFVGRAEPLGVYHVIVGRRVG